MLLTPDGGVGSITAGCLEDEVQRIARDVLAEGTPRVETYDLMEDDDDVWGLGVGCNGVIDILLEPLDRSYEPALDAYEAGDPVGVVRVLEGDQAGARGFYFPGEGVTGLPDDLGDAIDGPASALLEREGSDTLSIDIAPDSRATVFVDGLIPPPELVVFGTGHDVGPVIELARRADFRVTVVGFRGATATEERFPAADAVTATSPTQVRDAHEFDDRTYAVVMTHNFVDDRLALEELFETPVPYIGLLGPRERFEEMIEEFSAEGRSLSETELERLYTPAGLDLGGGTPHQIAMAIVSEVIAVHNDRTPRHLREREGHIHDRIEVEATD